MRNLQSNSTLKPDYLDNHKCIKSENPNLTENMSKEISLEINESGKNKRRLAVSQQDASMIQKTIQLPPNKQSTQYLRNSNIENLHKLATMDAGNFSNAVKQISLEEKKRYNSLFLFSDDSTIRKACKYVSESKPFEIIILLAILSNCVLLAMNAPLPNDDLSYINTQLEKSELYMLTIFCTECLLKIISNGFVLHRGSYLRSSWNILDFIVVVTGILSLPQLNFNIKASFIKVLRAARVLRPLKLISGIPSLQVVMSSIGKAMIPLMNIGILLLFFILICAIVGNLFLSGKWLNICVNLKDNTTFVDDIDYKICSVSSGGYTCPEGYECRHYTDYNGPNNGAISFDDIFHSMISVFACITSEGWTDMFYQSMDAIDVNGRFIWLFYYSINLIGAKFMLNLVLGVLSGEFAKERERVEKRREFQRLKLEQRDARIFQGYDLWIEKAEANNTSSTAMNVQAPTFNLSDQSNTNTIIRSWKQFLIDSKTLRWRIRSFVRHPLFFWVSMFVVFLNTLSVSSEHYNQPDWLTTVQYYAEISFITFFTLELVLKLFGIGPRKYLQNKFNCFDLVVVIFGLAEIVVAQITSSSIGLSIFRAFKILRLLKYTRHWAPLRNLITSLMSGIKSIISLMFLLLLAIVVFSLLGMQILGGSYDFFNSQCYYYYSCFF